MKLKGIALALALVAPAFGQAKLSIKGSDTLGGKMVPQLSEIYNALGNNVKFEIAAEGSSQAFTNLIDGTADIGMSSRSAKTSEVDQFTQKGQKLIEHVAGVDMIAVVVNSSNTVKALTKEQTEGIFTGTITDWSEVGGTPGTIAVYTRNETSGTYKTFQKLAMGKKDYAATSQKQAGNPQIVDQVAKNSKGIGYVGLAYATKEGVASVTVDGVKPDPEFKDTYPLSRNLYYYTVGEPTGETKKFLDWATTSEEAAAVITKVGFIPAN